MVLVAVTQACGERAHPATSLPSPANVNVTMREFHFAYDPHVPSGRVVFQFRNTGKLTHELSLWPLDHDFPPIQAQLHGQSRRLLTPYARSALVNAGSRGTFAVDLKPGQRYAVICFVHGREGEHEQLGMASEFRTPGAAP